MQPDAKQTLIVVEVSTPNINMYKDANAQIVEIF